MTHAAADMLRDTFTTPGFEILKQRMQWLIEEHRENIIQLTRANYTNDTYPTVNREAGRLEGIEGVVQILQELEKDAAKAISNDG